MEQEKTEREMNMEENGQKGVREGEKGTMKEEKTKDMGDLKRNKADKRLKNRISSRCCF